MKIRNIESDAYQGHWLDNYNKNRVRRKVSTLDPAPISHDYDVGNKQLHGCDVLLYGGKVIKSI